MNEGEDILAQLEAELSVETASLEYYITMPFDERLDLLLDVEKPTVTIKASGSTTHLEYPALFSPNAVEAVDVLIDKNTLSELELSAFSFEISGSMKIDHKKLKVEAIISPNGNEGAPTFLQNNPKNEDEYIMIQSTKDGFVSESLDAVALLHLLGSLADAEKSYIARALKEIEADDGKIRRKDLNVLIINTWSLIGYKMGSKEETKTLVHKVPQSSEMFLEAIKVQNIEEEKETETVTKFTLQKTKTFEGLDVEDTYSLKLEFSSDPEKAKNVIINQLAKRIVASGITALTLTNISAIRKTGGRETQLDLNDPEVITQFVDWFDQLVSA